jgi:hypothetical protein
MIIKPLDLLADHVTLREFVVIPESPTSGGWFLPAGDFNGDGFTDIFAGTTTSLEYIAFVNDARPQATIPNGLQACP